MARILRTKPTAPVLKTVSFKVPEALYLELDALRKRAEIFDDEVEFALDPLLVEALKKGIKVANRALDQIESERRSGRKT